MLKMMFIKKQIGAAITVAMAVAVVSCSHALPSDYSLAGRMASISPDYAGLVIPRNIAPLTCRINEDADDFLTCFRTSADPDGFVVCGQALDIPVDRWHRLLADADTVYADIYTCKGGHWTRYTTVANAVADSIDPYISYRLIEPGYIGFENMAICQRNLENFDEHEIFNNQAMSTEKEGQCINCHSYQDYNRDGNMQMHVRVGYGGTLVGHGGSLKKINLKTPETVSAGVYPSWHPTEPLIAYSNNTTSQTFHTRDLNKVEVQDAASDLVLYDLDTDRLCFIANNPAELETFPCWHPDGLSLWYVSAHVPEMTEKEMALYQALNYKDFKYDLYRKKFDPRTRRFEEADTVYRASALGKSVTLPRPSPDGRFLMFTQGGFGTFHIWHRDADLYMLDIATGETRPLDEINSDDVESYHSWSSSGKWVIFSSRRDDGSYTRLYLTHMGADGRFSKPFVLPQASPDADGCLFKSYNIPEFMVRPVDFSRSEFIEALEKDPVNVVMQQ